MVLIGAALVFPALGNALERRLGFVGRTADVASERLPTAGLVGQAAAGAVLALAWAPCAGPTLGAALILAAKGGSLAAAIAIMTVYALGAAGALIAVGFALGGLVGKARLAAAGAGGRVALGAAFAVIGAAILTGLRPPFRIRSGCGDARLADDVRDVAVTGTGANLPPSFQPGRERLCRTPPRAWHVAAILIPRR